MDNHEQESGKFLEEENNNLMDVPQVSPENGLGQDYNNVIAPLIMAYSLNGLQGIKDFAPGVRVPKYTERFPVDKYKDVITPKNQQLVADLDVLVDSINADLDNIDQIDGPAFDKKLDAFTSKIRGEEIT